MIESSTITSDFTFDTDSKYVFSPIGDSIDYSREEKIVDTMFKNTKFRDLTMHLANLWCDETHLMEIEISELLSPCYCTFTKKPNPNPINNDQCQLNVICENFDATVFRFRYESRVLIERELVSRHAEKNKECQYGVLLSGDKHQLLFFPDRCFLLSGGPVMEMTFTI